MTIQENPSEGWGDEVDRWLKSTGPKDYLLPTGVEYPVSLTVRDFLWKKGYILADEGGRRIRATEETTLYGLLTEGESTSSKFPPLRLLKRALSRIFRPSLRFVGVIYCPERESEWLTRIFGINNVESLNQLTEDIRSEFGKSITARLSSEQERKEKRFF